MAGAAALVDEEDGSWRSGNMSLALMPLKPSPEPPEGSCRRLEVEEGAGLLALEPCRLLPEAP